MTVFSSVHELLQASLCHTRRPQGGLHNAENGRERPTQLVQTRIMGPDRESKQEQLSKGVTPVLFLARRQATEDSENNYSDKPAPRGHPAATVLSLLPRYGLLLRVC
jgi:hypothetical protein